jgi:hypothetical protein
VLVLLQTLLELEKTTTKKMKCDKISMYHLR